MTDETIGIIACFKGWGSHPNYPYEENIGEYLRQHRGVEYHWTHDEYVNILYQTMADYLSTCDNPVKEIRRYFLDRMPWEQEPEYRRMEKFLELTQACANGHYINGFRDHPLWTKQINSTYKVIRRKQ